MTGFLCGRGGSGPSEADQLVVAQFEEFLAERDRGEAHTHHYVPVRDGRLSNGEPSYVQQCICGARPNERRTDG